MSESIQCPSCGTAMTAAARVCPACGRPRLLVHEHLLREESRTGIPYEVLLERVRTEDLVKSQVAELTAQVERRMLRFDRRMLALEGRLTAIERALPGLDRVPAPPRSRLRSSRPRSAPLLRRLSAAPPSPEPVFPAMPVVAAAAPAAPAVAPIQPVTRPQSPLPTVATPASRPTPPPTPAPTRPAAARWGRDWEEIIGRLGLAWVGGLAILVGAIFFLSLAFSRGWIGPSARVVIGVAASTALIGGGAWFFQRREALFGHVLTAVGLGVMSLSLLAATRLYHLIPIEVGLLGALASAVVAALIAVRFDTQVVAAFGIVAALAAPPVLGASPDATTVFFLGAALVGATGIALYRTWGWLPPLAFVLSAPQAAVWFVDDAPRTAGLAALVGFWLLHVLAAGGEEYRVRRAILQPWSATLLLANATFAVWAGFVLLDGDATRWRAPFLLAVAAAHGAISWYFLRAEGDRHPFGLLAAGTGIAALTMAVPVQFGGAPVAIAWAAEATALAWVADRRRHRYSAITALVLGALTVAHFVTIEYPLWEIATEFDRGLPFLTAEGATLAFILAAIATTAYLIRHAGVRVLLLILGVALTAFALPFEVSGTALVAGWSALAVGALASRRITAFTGDAADLARERRAGRSPAIARFVVRNRHRYSAITALVLGILTVAHFLTIEYPLWKIATGFDRDLPFLTAEGAALAFILAALATAGYLVRHAGARVVLLMLGIALIAFALPFEVSGTALVAGWSALAVGTLASRSLAAFTIAGADLAGERRAGRVPAIARFVVRHHHYHAIAALVLGALTVAHFVTMEYPLWEIATGFDRDLPFLTAEGAALAFILAALATAGYLVRHAGVRVLLLMLGIALIAFALPFEVSDLALLAGWSALAVGALASRRLAAFTVDADDLAGEFWAPVRDIIRRGAEVAATAMAALAAGHLLKFDIPLDALSTLVRPATPFTDRETLAAVIAVAAALLGAGLTPLWPVRRAALVVAVAVAAYLMPFELHEAAMVVAWAVLALVAVALLAWDRRGYEVYLGLGVILLGSGAMVAIGAVAPPDRLGVRAVSSVDHPLFWSGATAAFGALAAVLGVAVWSTRRAPWAQAAAGLAGAMIVYLLSVGVVDEFQRQVGGETDLASLQERAQVALSILWATLGGIVFAAGIARFGRPARLFGLGLLGLATVKVFVYDLASLDASYRVLSFIGLGILLLACSYLYQRLFARNGRDGADASGETPESDAADQHPQPTGRRYRSADGLHPHSDRPAVDPPLDV